MKAASNSTRENVLFSVLDYVSQPLILLFATPVLLRSLGVQQYGTWILVNSIAATASGLGGGFGDGAIKYVAMYRGRGDERGAVRSLLAVLAVNCTFGLAAAAVLSLCAPWLIDRVFAVQPALQHTGVVAVRISAGLLVLRFAESVFTSALRGCEQYRAMVVTSVSGRSLATLLAAALALQGQGLVPIFWTSLIVGAASLAIQAWLTSRTLPILASARGLSIGLGAREVFSFGSFTWMKASLGVLVAYADRLLIAALLGTGPLAFYAICSQLTQPIPAFLASVWNFVFPRLSAQSASGSWTALRRSYRVSLFISSLLVLIFFAGIVVLSNLILGVWIGPARGPQYKTLLVTMAIGNALLALTVVPNYAALALGRAKALAMVNLVAGIASVAALYLLLPRAGLLGAGIAKIITGAIFLSVFSIVRRALEEEERSHSTTLHTTPIRSLDFAQHGGLG